MEISRIRSVHKQGGYLQIAKRISESIGLGKTNSDVSVFKISSLPSEIRLSLFLDSLLGLQFMLYHEFSTGNTFLITDKENLVDRVESTMLGFKADRMVDKQFGTQNLLYVVGFDPNMGDRMNLISPLEDMYNVLKGLSSGLFVSFVPADIKYVESMKRRVEEILSSGDIRMTKNFGNKPLSVLSGSVQSEVYYDSDQRKGYITMLDTLNEAMLNNGSSYKISLILENLKTEDCRLINDYLKRKLSVLEERSLKARDLGDLYGIARTKDAFCFSQNGSTRLVNFSGSIRRLKIMQTRTNPEIFKNGDISLGFYLDGSVNETGKEVRTEVSTLNLGTLITGLPGSGKTFASMNILKQVIGLGQTEVVIIAPTEEWVAFGLENGMEVISLYGSGTKVNFFRCGEQTDVVKFYENLAMLIAHASNSGPYRNSIEKCLLSAFNRIYSKTKNPDPLEVYEEIEEAIIEKHGKRSSLGVKYTKHGENVRAGIESLRLMLLKPQFAYAEGLDFEKILNKGVIFDLSKISNSMKPFFYALVLNQVYANAEEFDLNGNDKLRMLICLEEAQLIFDNDEQSAATMDLRQRIQDFRKKGIGVMLITHSVNDINLRIRRLCQTKMYFRQSADSVGEAADDLITDDKILEDLADKFKSLEHRTCVLNYISCINGVKSPADSVFVRIPKYPLSGETIHYNYPVEPLPETRIVIVDENNCPIPEKIVEVDYVGQRVFKGRTDKEGSLLLEDLLKNRRYRLFVFGEKKRDTKSFEILGGRETVIKFS